MTTAEITSMIEEMGIESVYYAWEDTGKAPPFICYYYPSEMHLDAGDFIAEKALEVVLELYTRAREFDLEKTVEKVLQNHEIAYEKRWQMFESENMSQTVYTLDVELSEEEEDG